MACRRPGFAQTRGWVLAELALGPGCVLALCQSQLSVGLMRRLEGIRTGTKVAVVGHRCGTVLVLGWKGIGRDGGQEIEELWVRNFLTERRTVTFF